MNQEEQAAALQARKKELEDRVTAGIEQMKYQMNEEESKEHSRSLIEMIDEILRIHRQQQEEAGHPIVDKDDDASEREDLGQG